MIAFAALVAQGRPSAAAVASHPDADLARALLTDSRPKRLASAETLMSWAAESQGISAGLLAACLAASGDRSEVAALLLPAAVGPPPRLGEVIDALTRAAGLAEADRRAVWLSFALRLPPDARLVLNRLASGGFRLALKPDIPPQGGPRSFRAVLTMLSFQGPEATFALRQGNGLVPIARLPLVLPETAEILAWARAHVADRFGPNWQLSPDLVFELACDGTIPNTRRKSGLDLVAPSLLAWLRDATPDQANSLQDFTASP